MAKKNVDKKEEMQRVCEGLGVNKLYYNTKGEYFTEPGYAYASEAGDKKKVGVYIATTDKEEVKEPEGGTDE